MQCPRCQHPNPTSMKSCGECAAPLAATCPSCGAANPPENKFCGQCAAPRRTAATAKFAAPDSYTPKHLADLKGSMELLAGRDPEEARKILDPVLELMMEAVRHGFDPSANLRIGGLRWASDAVVLARELGHRHTLAQLLYHAARLYQYPREPRTVAKHAEACVAVSEEQGFSFCGRMG